MEKKLKRKFILLGIAAVLILLLLVGAGFHYFSYRQMYRSLDLTLSYIINHSDAYEEESERSGSDSEKEGAGEETEAETDGLIITGSRDGDVSVKTLPGDEQNLLEKLVIGFRDFGDSIAGNVELTPESRYRMRYFLITLDENGNVEKTSLSHIAEINEETARQLALNQYRFHRKSGMIEYARSSYYYKSVPQPDGLTVIGFLECTQEVRSVNAMRAITLLVCMLVVVLFVVILRLLSRRAIAPYVENIISQKQFITNASHELKTPLAIISANAEAIEMIDGKSEWTDNILAQVRRSTDLINSMLALARMSETQKTELTQVGLTDVVRESVTSFQAVVSQKGRKLESEIADGIFVMGDRNLLMELSNILIDNAVKYCDDDGTIHVALRKKGKAGAVLSVANDYQKGAGLDCSRFFRRFYRGDSSHNSGMEGHGIGLSMAKSITEKMGGSIGAAWKDGIITFTVIL